jgi:protocatechuate 3,4-dioxygenase alpha subunit
MTGQEAQGERIHLRIRLLDGDGIPVPDAIIELWQADANGRYNHPADAQSGSADPAFCGFGRLATDAEGVCTFDTIRPGHVPDGKCALQAAHISVSVFARGLQGRLCTRVYLEGDPALNKDPILTLVPPERRQTLIAQRDSENSDWKIDIHLQGEQETVFFDI